MEKGENMQSKEESGRTMMEMLGVLAVMGIVMYGVLVGINSGITSYKVNQAYINIDETIKGIQDMYTGIYGKNRVPYNFECDYVAHPESDGCKALTSNNIKPRGMKIQREGRSFKITYTADSSSICERLVKLDWKVLSINCKGNNNQDCKNYTDETAQVVCRTPKVYFSPM